MGRGGLRRLGDYPRGTWVEAADGCDICGARNQVRVLSLDEDGYGEVQVRITHRPHCPAALDEDPEGHGAGYRREQAGWKYRAKSIVVRGEEWTPIAARADVSICLGCGRLVADGLIILFIDGGRGGELDFCLGCAQELGLLEKLRARHG